jgi:hypothetical protein
LYNIIETLKETGTIPFIERGWTARDIPHIAEISHEFAVRKRIPNGIFGENASLRVQRAGPFFQTPRGKRNIRCYHDIAIPDPRYDPIICGIKLLIYNHQLKKIFLRNPHPRIGNQVHLEPVAPGYSIDFILHRAAIRINIEGHQAAPRLWGTWETESEQSISLIL